MTDRLAWILDICRAQCPALDTEDVRILSAALGRHHDALRQWGAGIDIAYARALIIDVEHRIDIAHGLATPPGQTGPRRVEPAEVRNALWALHTYFSHRARRTVRVTRADYERELTQIYLPELVFLRALGHTPAITWLGVGLEFCHLAVDLGSRYRLEATNAEDRLVGSGTDRRPGPWTVRLRDTRTRRMVTAVTHPDFTTAYTRACTPVRTPRRWRLARTFHLTPPLAKRTVRIPHRMASRVDQIVGLDHEGCVIIRHELIGLLVLTPCCHADGKGDINSPTQLSCRRCGRAVGVKHGGEPEIFTSREELDVIVSKPFRGHTSTMSSDPAATSSG